MMISTALRNRSQPAAAASLSSYSRWLKPDQQGGRWPFSVILTRLRFAETSAWLEVQESNKRVISVQNTSSLLGDMTGPEAWSHRNIYKYFSAFRCRSMQIHAKPDTDLNSPDARAVNTQKWKVFAIFCFASCQKHSPFFSLICKCGESDLCVGLN